MSEQTRYFNFPISMLSGFLKDRETCLRNIVRYCLFAHATEKLEEGTLLERIQASASYLGVKIECPTTSLELGREAYNSTMIGKVKTGLKTDILWDYVKNYKTPFEEVCLLAYLGLKSIVQKKSYCKVTNMFLLSRMDGWNVNVNDQDILSDEIRKYNNEYQMKKIKAELMENWGVKHYGRYTKGFYVSFTMEYKDLVYEIEKKRKKTQLERQKKKKEDALKEAMQRLELEI